jgi:acyl carrier protein
MSDPLADTVIAALAEVKHIAPEGITADSTFAELGVDSLDAITLLFELENRLAIVIPDEAARSARSVRDVIEGLRTLIAGGAAGVPLPPAAGSS